MGLETGTYINSLVASNPVNLTDVVGQGDDHLRLIKSTILNTFPNITGEMDLTHTQLNNAAVKDEANVFTNEQQRISGAIPRWQLFEDDQVTDGGAWDLIASAGQFGIRTRDDSFTGGNLALGIERTAAVVDAIDFYTPLARVRDGGVLRVQDAGDTDYISFSHDGSDAYITSVNTNAFRFQDASFARFDDGMDVRVYDATNADYLSLLHNGTNAVLTSNAGDITLDPASAFVNVDNGGLLRIYDSDASDNLLLRHDGTSGRLVASNRLDLESSSGNIQLEPSTQQVFISASSDPLLGFIAGGTTKAFITYDNADSELRIDSDGGIEVFTNNSQILEIGTNGAIVTNNTSPAEFGFKGEPINEQNGNYTLALTDAGKAVAKVSGASGETYTVPPNSSVAFPLGSIVVVHNRGGGTLTIAQGSGVTITEWGSATSGNKTLADDGKAILEKVATDTWMISGIGLS